MNQSKKYQRCLVMAGGGFHFAYYLGIHAALCDSGKRPDLLLASCGGAIAAALIQALPDDAQRRDWIASKDMYRFWCGLKSTPKAKVTHAFFNAMRRRFRGHNAKIIPDLFQDYMFEIPPDLPLPEVKQKSVDVAIVAGRLNYAEHEVGQQRGNRKLFSEIIFCEQRAADLLHEFPVPLSDPRFGEHAIDAALLTKVDMPLADAVRASISDMFYFRCHRHASGNYMGGVVDLFPIEVASHLAHSVIMERKAGYDETYGIPAIRTVLGFDGNQRLLHVLGQHADAWVDTSDMEQVFLHQRIFQKIIWYKNRIQIVAPATHAAYVNMIEAQWAFGYQRAMAGLASAST